MDPLGEERPHISPYAYVQANPLNRVDRHGLLDDWFIDENGFIAYDSRVHSQADLNRLGIKGTYVGPTFSGILPDGKRVRGDASGMMTFDLPGVTIVELKEFKKSIPGLIGTIFGNQGNISSLLANAREYKKLEEIHKRGEFLSYYKGNERVWKKGFFGNPSVDPTFVRYAKGNFSVTLNFFRVLHYGGKTLGYISFVFSTIDLFMTDDSVVLAVTDYAMSGVAFLGTPGLIISLSYFAIRNHTEMMIRDQDYYKAFTGNYIILNK